MKIIICVILSTLFIVQASSFRWSSIYVARTICEVVSDAPEPLVEIARTRDFSLNDDDVQKYAVCVYHRLDLLSPDGTLDDKAGDRVPKANPEKYAAAVNACKHISGRDVKDRLWNMISCFYKHYPDCVSVL